MEGVQSVETLEEVFLRKGPSRPGFDNSDPWFDGRTPLFNYSIIREPYHGTVLTFKEIKRAILYYGNLEKKIEADASSVSLFIVPFIYNEGRETAQKMKKGILQQLLAKKQFSVDSFISDIANGINQNVGSSLAMKKRYLQNAFWKLGNVGDHQIHEVIPGHSADENVQKVIEDYFIDNIRNRIYPAMSEREKNMLQDFSRKQRDVDKDQAAFIKEFLIERCLHFDFVSKEFDELTLVPPPVDNSFQDMISFDKLHLTTRIDSIGDLKINLGISISLFENGIGFLKIPVRIIPEDPGKKKKKLSLSDIVDMNYFFGNFSQDFPDVLSSEKQNSAFNLRKMVRKIMEGTSIREFELPNAYSFHYFAHPENQLEPMVTPEQMYFAYYKLLMNKSNFTSNRPHIDYISASSQDFIFRPSDGVTFGFDHFGGLIDLKEPTSKRNVMVKSLFIYPDIFILALHQRLSLMEISDKLAKVEKILDFKEGRNNISELRKEIIYFTNRHWFTQITHNRIGTEIWNRWRMILGINELYSEMKDELSELDNFLTERHNKWVSGIIQKLTIIFLPLNILALILNIKNAIGEGKEVSIYVVWVIILIVFLYTGIYFTVHNLWNKSE